MLWEQRQLADKRLVRKYVSKLREGAHNPDSLRLAIRIVRGRMRLRRGFNRNHLLHCRCAACAMPASLTVPPPTGRMVFSYPHGAPES